MSEIHQAAQAGNLDELRRLIAEGVPVDSYDEESGHTPLMMACMSPQAGLEVLDLLIDSGADVNAPVRPEEEPQFEMPDIPEDESVDEETRTMLREIAESRSAYSPDVPPLPVAVLRETSLEKLKLLFARGADLHARSAQGYSLVITAIFDPRSEILDYLLAAGAPVDGVTKYGESALRVLSREGKFAEVRKLLALGADPAPLEWTPLMHAVAAGEFGEVRSLLEAGIDLEARDYWERTAFLLSIHAGQLEIAEYLLVQGARRDARGRCKRTATSYPVSRNDIATLQWLLDRGFDPEDKNEFGHTTLKDAIEASATDCVRLLLEAGVDWRRGDHVKKPLIHSASEPEIIRMLIERGADPVDLETDALRSYIGLKTEKDLTLSREDYFAGRFRRFGTANPERMEVPFWKAMVNCGWNAYQAGKQFDDDSYDRGAPTWCYDRFGMSLTALPDGRFIQIGGEHEDHYDPDFCIYNEVFIHDGKGGFEILGYPEEVFPPTDFHSATLVEEWIYIIGRLGYPEGRGGRTPVYRLHVKSGMMETVKATGEDPGWIYGHKAKLKDGRIRVWGGKAVTIGEDGDQNFGRNRASHRFDPASRVWERISKEA
jgi:ankyrin repeat protein